MNKNKETLKTYEKIAKQYSELNASNETITQHQILFHSLLKKGIIYDFGCGTGRDVKYFSEIGYQVKGFDASESMLDIAKKNFPNNHFQKLDMLTKEWDIAERPNGIWACASLLHFNEKDFKEVFNKLVNLLNHNGILYFSLKLKSELSNEFVDGRFFQYYTKELLDNFISEFNELSLIHYEENKSKNDTFGSYFLKKI